MTVHNAGFRCWLSMLALQQATGWLQVHDEVILEGPAESADRAQELVVDCMMRPFDGRNPLDVELVVDAKHAGTWFAAK